ncbi:uncharacterized protein LOC110032999 [Phalaenopsis equestris]|uniref:uncharacterized protein LOC110032999 n=1 Tax=Phalaenopsis equestris TaxID=78828 RepID=UPI0009E4D4EE|nr:uncharacterized protein LOC110032999 [Phalaenopsis equestris]
MDPIISFLQDRTLPNDATTSIRIRSMAANFILIGDELYEKAFVGLYLKCLPPSEADYALREVHSGICGSILVVGVDIIVSFPIATGQQKFIILAVDYFTKWVEAKLLAKITEANAKQFVWKNIICRFGLPAKIITNNRTQFTGRVFTSFCKDLHIQLVHTAVAHPQTNGQTEVKNRTVLKGLKTRLEKAGGQWVEELHNVLWAYHTTTRTPTGETPYNLCFGTEAVVPVDIGIPNPRVKTFDLEGNEEKLRQLLDLLPEIHDVAHLRAASYRQRVARHFNRRGKPRL